MMQLLGWWKSDDGWVSDISISAMETYILGHKLIELEGHLDVPEFS